MLSAALCFLGPPARRFVTVVLDAVVIGSVSYRVPTMAQLRAITWIQAHAIHPLLSQNLSALCRALNIGVVRATREGIGFPKCK